MNIGEYTHQLIDGELKKRGLDDGNFKIRECLILLPKDQNPKFYFDEIPWRLSLKDANYTKGQNVYISDLRLIDSIEFPKHNKKKVAFIYLFYDGFEYSIIFNFEPNHPKFADNNIDDYNWEGSKLIAKHLNLKYTEIAFKGYENEIMNLSKLGLFIAPSLIPYPLNGILQKYKDNDKAGVIELLISHCDNEFLENRVREWGFVDCFKQRAVLFKECLSAHFEEKYTLSISTLVTQVEGVISDWIQSLDLDLKWRMDSKLMDFKKQLETKEKLLFSEAKMIESLHLFFKNSSFSETFKNWSQSVSTVFPNRHVVAHGKFDSENYTKENSIKLFLLIDSIFWLMRFRS